MDICTKFCANPDLDDLDVEIFERLSENLLKSEDHQSQNVH